MKSAHQQLSTLHERTRLPAPVAQWLKVPTGATTETLEAELSAALDFVAVHGEEGASLDRGEPDAVDE